MKPNRVDGANWGARLIVILLTCGFAFVAPARAAKAPKKKSSLDANGEVLSAAGPVLRLRIEFDRQTLDSLRRDPRKFVRARVIDLTSGTNVYDGVAVHLKGAAGSFRDIDSKPALTLNFDKFNPDQRFYGLMKMHLNNSVQDPSYSTESICGDLFNAAGVPSARSGNARVWINGRDRGFYVVKEGFIKDFVKRYFPSAKGNFYDGGFLRDVDQPLQKDFGEGPDDHSDLKALTAAARESDVGKRWERLNQVLDMDRFISFVAMDMLIWDWDGYPLHHNNYRLYCDPESGKFVFIPHGMDQMFWDANGPLLPGMEGLVASAVLSTPQGKRLYRERVSELFTNVFRLEWLTNMVAALDARNRPAIAELGEHALREYDDGIGVVYDRIVQRWHGVYRQIKPWLIPPPTAVAFNDDIAKLTAWRIEEERPAEKGHARLEQTAAPDGRPSLSIAASGSTTASWRSLVKLEPGLYRLEGMASGVGILPLERKVPDSNKKLPEERKGSGAGLRISGIQKPRTNQLVGDARWTKLEYEFPVSPAGEDVEIVCELRATKGQVWFDLESLRIVRIK